MTVWALTESTCVDFFNVCLLFHGEQATGLFPLTPDFLKRVIIKIPFSMQANTVKEVYDIKPRKKILFNNITNLWSGILKNVCRELSGVAK